MKKIDLKEIEKVEIRDIWEHEGTEFTPWLAKEDNIKLLSKHTPVARILKGRGEGGGGAAPKWQNVYLT